MKPQLLIAAIASAFAANPKASKLFVTSDGNCFLESNRSFADYHARSLGEKVREVNREDFEKDQAAAMKAAAKKPDADEVEAQTSGDNGLGDTKDVETHGTKGAKKGKGK